MGGFVSFSRGPLRFTLRSFAAFAALVLTSSGTSIFAQDTSQQAAPILTVIVTRHGVRSYPYADDKALVNAEDELDQSHYSWADWSPIERTASYLTRHGYRLMKIMGEFYKQTQIAEKLPVDCPANNMFVYADTDQRTLGTAHALIEGMCGPDALPDALKVFHEADTNRKSQDCQGKDIDYPKDPIFNATDWLCHNHRIEGSASKTAVAAAAGDLGRLVPDHKDYFGSFQKLLDKRCKGGGCAPLSGPPDTSIEAKSDRLATLKGPVGKARTYSEDVFLEYAQCGDIANPVTKGQAPGKPAKPSDEDLAALQAGMHLHVLAYGISARNDYRNKDESLVYDPYIRGETLLWHIVAILDEKAGRTTVSHESATPSQLKDKAIVIFSGHDTELGALGGILDAHWETRNGDIEPDDMPPGSALVFDLMPGSDKHYSVRLRFASMARDRFRREDPLNTKNSLNDGISFYPVKYGICEGKGTKRAKCNCDTEGCSAPLEEFETVALNGVKKEGKEIVAYPWNVSSERLESDPGSSQGVSDPEWTHCDSR